MTPKKARSLYAYKLARARQRALGLPCWICGEPIDYRAQPRTRWAFSLDHIVALSAGGALLDPANHRSAHTGCNARRGVRQRDAHKTRPRCSRDW